MLVTPIRREDSEGHILSLTLEREYEVLGIEADSYRILNDQRDPVLYEPSSFQILDASEPTFWVSRVGEDGERYAYPEAWAYAGFFEDFHDGLPVALDTFWKTLSRLFPKTASSGTERSRTMARGLAPKIEAANVELIANGNLDAVGDFFAPDYVAHGTQQEMRGLEGLRKYLGLLKRAFPDLQVEVEILVEGKDRVAWQRTCRATHRGSFKGFPATRRPIVWRDMVASRFRDGLIAEDWVITDLAERLLLARKSD